MESSFGVLLIKIPLRSEEFGAESRGLALQPSRNTRQDLAMWPGLAPLSWNRVNETIPTLDHTKEQWGV